MESNGCDLGLLSASVLHKVFCQLCNSQDLASCRVVCKEWSSAADAAVHSVWPHKSLQFLSKFSSVHCLDLQWMPKVQLTDLHQLTHCPHLGSISFSQTTANVDNCICTLATLHLPQLTHLSFGSNTDTAAAALPRLTNLRSLKMISWEVTNQAVSSIAQLCQLDTLYLGCCDGITDDGLLPLTAITSLTSLTLDTCSHLTDEAMAHLAQLAQLTALCLRWSVDDVTATGLQALSALTQLQLLDLHGSCEAAGSVALMHLLAALPALTHLDVGHNENVESFVLSQVLMMQHLTCLCLSGISVRALGFTVPELKRLSQLAVLDLRWNGKLHDVHCIPVSSLTSLTSLDVSYCPALTTSGLSMLRDLTALKTLKAHKHGRGNVDWSFLTSLSQLQELWVRVLRAGCDSCACMGVAMPAAGHVLLCRKPVFPVPCA